MDSDLLQLWKDKYGQVYSATIGQQEYHFRALTLAEVDRLVQFSKDGGGSADLEDLYVEAGILHPEIDLNKIKPGFITRLAEEIQYVSGSGDVVYLFETFIEERESFEQDVLLMMKAFIMTAIPVITEEQIDNMTMRQVIHKIVLAEHIMNFQQSINGVPEPDVQFQLQVAQPEGAEPEKKKLAGPPDQHTREQMLRDIRHQEKEVVGEQGAAAVKGFENFDEDLLLKVSGSESAIKEEDPIARKLRLAMGG